MYIAAIIHTNILLLTNIQFSDNAFNLEHIITSIIKSTLQLSRDPHIKH